MRVLCRLAIVAALLKRLIIRARFVAQACEAIRAFVCIVTALWHRLRVCVVAQACEAIRVSACIVALCALYICAWAIVRCTDFALLVAICDCARGGV